MIPISELDLIKIGEIIKTHGYKGELIIKLSENFNKLKKTELLFFEIDGNMVPFFFEYKPKPYKRSGLLAKFENLNSDSEVEEILYSPVFTSQDNIIKEESFVDESIKGYKVYDNEILIGIADDFLNIPSNPVLTVISENYNEILIPVNEEFIIKIDEKKRIIIFNLPEGLIDINN